MIEHVYQRAAAAQGVDAVVVATDDARIAMTVEGFGGTVRMTRSIHRTGSDRIAEVAADLQCDIIVNVQGDEPLLAPQMIAEVLEPLEEDASLQMATLRRLITDPADYDNPNVVKVVTDRQGHALYFSRAPVPLVRDDPSRRVVSGLHHIHLGVYIYTKETLLRFASMKTGVLEDAEKLEQLRALENGIRVRVWETAYASLRIDAPEESRTVTRYGVRDVVVSRLGDDYLDWRRAVIRLKEAAALYDTDPKGVEFVDRGLFRAQVKLPTEIGRAHV